MLSRTPPKTGSNQASPGSPRGRIHSVSTRIILFVFTSTLLTTVVLSWLSVGAFYRDNQEQVLRRNQSLLGERGPKLEQWQAMAQDALAAAAAPGSRWHGEILDSLPADGRTAMIPVPSELTEFVDRIEIRPDGDRRARTEVELREACLPLLVDLADGGAKPFSIEACLAEGSVLGILRPPVGEFRGSRLLVVDHSGRVLAAAGVRASTRIGEVLPFAFRAHGHEAETTTGPARLLTYAGRAGAPLVASTRMLGSTGLTLVAETSHAHAFSQTSAIIKQIFVLDVCIILLFTVLASKITLAIMKPIQALSEGAQRIARGQVDYQIPVPHNNHDELGLLTRTFNDMMARLRSNQLEIEQDRLRLGEKNEELQHANEILSQLSITDGLTKLHNHRYFQDHLTREIKRVSRTKAPLTLILIDIDDFKLLNDTYGHAAGDEVLMSLASIMNDSARESDLIARYGGEEFVVLMPNTDIPGAVHLAEKIRMTVESTRLIIGDTMRPVDITISVGVAIYRGDRKEFFAEADRALYRAKAAGKNCVIIAGATPEQGADPDEGETGSASTA